MKKRKPRAVVEEEETATMSPDPRSVKKRKAAAVVEENLPDTHEEEDGDAQEAENETPVKINTQDF